MMMNSTAESLDIENRVLSQTLFEESKNILPGGVNSPVRACGSLLSTPIVVKKGQKACIIDIDGHEYIDYCNSWGALILGHANPHVTSAVIERVKNGSTFGITTEEESHFGHQLRRHFPSMEKMRFVSSGTEATMSAIRLARGFTGRELIVKFDGHYHGHADSLLIQAGSGVFNLNSTSSSLGVPKDFVKHTLSLPFNDIETCRKALRSENIRHHLAAIILEPIAANMGVIPADPLFIEMLKEECEKCGALLIFDEIVTGFRVGLKGAQAYYKISPDMTCLGKIIGGGFPAAAFGGREEILNCLAPLGGVYQAGTLSGNPVAMVAGIETVSQIETPHFYEDLEEKTNRLINPVKELLYQKNIQACIQNIGSMWTLFFGKTKVHHRKDVLECDIEKFGDFFRYMLAKGIYLSPSPYEAHFVSSAHTDEQIEKTSSFILEYLNDCR